MSTLESVLDEKRRSVFTQQYDMSIGELSNLYKDNELLLNPNFQRFYRWTSIQKTKLIESILLGIPIPPIYVAQREDGKWEVIDGLQRLSTIFSFIGILKDKDGNLIPPFHLQGTEDIPELDNVKWENQNDEDYTEFSGTQRIDFKRSPLTIVIIKKISDSSTKYDLFQRLNTGGTPLSNQEVRNCLLVMEDVSFYEYIEKLATVSDFLDCIALSDKSLNEQEHFELVLKFFIFKNTSSEDLLTHNDLNTLITMKAIEFAKSDNFDRALEESIFMQTFEKIQSLLGDTAFKKFNHLKAKTTGGFLISGFETIAIGIGLNIQNNTLISDEKIKSTCKDLWEDTEFKSVSGSGSNAKRRLPQLLPLGKRLFSNEN